MEIFSGNGQSGLVCVEVMRVSASMPSVSVTAEASTRGCAAIARVGRNSSQSAGSEEAAPAPCSGIERQALAHCIPRVALERGIVADSRIDRGELIGDGLVDQRLDLRRHVDARAGHRKVGVAERHLAGQIRLDTPGGGKLRPRGDDDVALDLGVGIERLDVDAADLLGGIAAEQAAERVADRAGRLRRQRARDVQLSGQRRRQRQHVLRAGRRDRPARGGPADVGILQDLRHRIVGLAREGARRAAVGGVANRGEAKPRPAQ